MSNHHLDRRRLFLAGAGIATTATLTSFEPAAAGESRTKVFKGEFTDAEGPDWHYVPFTVPRGVREIEVHYDYEPTPLGPTTLNVVDIGIFDPSGNGLGDVAGFRGWSGGARRSFRLSREKATPGYLPGPITPGRWNIILGPYQIGFGGTPWEVRVTLRFGRPGPKFVPTPAPASVPGTGQGWYRGDLHVHTVHSDGSQTQRDVLTDAQAAGLNFIGTSEHNTSTAQLTWGRVVPDGFLVIPGEEVTTRAGHWLATGIEPGTWIDWRYRPEDDQLARFTQQARDAGGIAIAAHPYQFGTGIGWEFGYDFESMDAIEVWNGPWGSDDERTVGRWHRLLAAGRFLPAVGNSDSHKHSQQIGLPQTAVRSESLSAAAIIAGYRNGHSWIAESSAVDLTFTATLDDVTGECGDHVPGAEGDQVAVRLEVSGVRGCLGQVHGPRGILAGALADESGQLVVEVAVPGGTAFVRAEVRRPTAAATDPTAVSVDPMVALTNPIFLTAAE